MSPATPAVPDDVEVVSTSLAIPDARLAELRAWLSEDERARAQRFVFEEHRRRFAAGRGLLRELLARRLGRPPEAIRFDQGPHGKPRLAPGFDPSLRFNLSHSQDRAVFALARDRELGVDIEEVRGGIDHAAVARRFFSPGERAALLALPGPERASAFFAIWTRKEAYVKLLGGGLAIPLDSFDVSWDEPARLLRCAGEAGGQRIELRAVEAPAGYRAALAFEATAFARSPPRVL